MDKQENEPVTAKRRNPSATREQEREWNRMVQELEQREQEAGKNAGNT
jgi:hypothetical protein